MRTVSAIFILGLIFFTGISTPKIGNQSPRARSRISQSQTNKSTMYLVTTNGQYRFIDQTGRVKIELPPDTYFARDFSDGLAAFAIRSPQHAGGLWGFINQDGKVVIAPKLDHATFFSEGLSAVEVKPDEKTTRKLGYITAGKLGYIDRSGKLVIQTKFGAGPMGTNTFSEGLAAVEIKYGQWGYIDKTGSVVIKGPFGKAGNFQSGRAGACICKTQIDCKCGFIDKRGAWIITPQFVEVHNFSGGLAYVALGEGRKIGYINLVGKLVIQAQFDYGFCGEFEGSPSSRSFSEGLAAVKIGFNWGFIDRTEKVVIEPKYDCAHGFRESLAVIGIRNGLGMKFGYINRAGQYVIEPKFAVAESFSEGVARVSTGLTNDELALRLLEAASKEKDPARIKQINEETETLRLKTGYIDKTGKFIWQPTN